MTTNNKQAALDALAQEYVYRLHGRGLSTSVGIHTRSLLKSAFIDGYNRALTEPDVPDLIRVIEMADTAFKDIVNCESGTIARKIAVDMRSEIRKLKGE